MFELTGRIGFSEGGADGKLHLHQLINYFQNTSTFHVTDTDIKMPTPQTGFYMLSWQILINRLPDVGETVNTGTLIHELRGVYGSRNYWMDSGDGVRLAYANMNGCFVDLTTQKLYKLSSGDTAFFPLEEKLEMEYLPRKIKVPLALEKKKPQKVLPRHLDMYGHVNNAEYLAIASGFLPPGLAYSQIRIEYKKAALLGDDLYPLTGEWECKYYIILADALQNPFAIFEFSF
ncbi:MAG: thioesterase [Turicibacter sp.]|nr:thioesterase [Turicibacter sp.]